MDLLCLYRQRGRDKMTKKTAREDLGTGNIPELMLKLAVPTIIAQVVNMLYNMVDRIYIGHISGVGDVALTGLGLCFPVLMMVAAFANLIGTGGAPRAAIFMGKNDNRTAEVILGNSVTALLLLSVVMTIGLELAAEPILWLFGASEATMPYALGYLRIYLCGSVCVMMTLGLNSFITTQGFTNISMKTVLIGAVSNIILDPIFIFQFHMGVRGAALATVISQGISALWVLLFLVGRQTKLRIKKEYMRISAQILVPVVTLGMATFVMNITECLLNIAFNISLSRYGGDLAVGAMTILASIMQLQVMPAAGIGQGAQPLLSYNYGAGKEDRVRKTIKILFISSMIYSLSFWLVLELFPGIFVQMFNSSSTELYDITVWAVRIYMGATGVFALQNCIQQVFVSLGQAKLSLFIACLRKLILLIPLICILPLFFEDKVFAVFLAEPISDLTSVTVATILFACNIKRILNEGEKSKAR